MAAAYYKQQDHIRRVSARSFLTNISLDGSHRDTCYGKLVASIHHSIQVDASGDGLPQDSRSTNDQLCEAICPVSALELTDIVPDDDQTADSYTADSVAETRQQHLSESNLFRYTQCCCGGLSPPE